MRLKYEPASEPLHIYVEWLFLNVGRWASSNRIKLVKVGGLELLVRLCASSDNEAQTPPLKPRN